ncbi:copper amine oxidase [Streptomyces sp. TLI_105]|uniref:copper amine oxidase n=1 Tax=Streptomyces sp. TLI_105 TaxID=1881019 RepID=UPI00089A2599|nr:copper amine oxidase [Streptomyces sp. TLI_105]SEC19287.1 primary-amine oxidase [Streptomyces sp. TLI_105]
MSIQRIRNGRTRKRGAVLTAAALLGTATAAAGPVGGAVAAPNPPAPTRPARATTTPDCSAAYRITQKLDGGTTWRMCWRYDTDAGLTLDRVTYQPPGAAAPIPVLNSARLAQIHVPYDDGGAEYDDLTGAGFGWGLQNLKPAECPGGTLTTVKVPEVGDVKGLCTTTRARGHAYRVASDSGSKVWQAQAKDLLVYTVNKVGWYEYITEWRFTADGTIGANVGATGSLSPVDYNATDGRGWPLGKGARGYATSHAHNVFWKLDFGLDGSTKDRIEQFDSTVTAPTGGGGPTVKTTRTVVTKELAGDAKNMRWWRVVSGTGKNADGHARSYEIVPGHTDTHAGRGFTKHDVYFTQSRACEKFASNNIGGCAAGAGDSVDKWVNGETLTKPSVWVNIGFHHIARDEDQQPMPVHWQGFQLAPRDVTAMNPLTPADLASQNGQPDLGS